MNPLYSVAEIRSIEHAAAQRLPAGALMQRAGQAAANAALDMLPFSTSRAKVLVLAGPGNNGGDALEVAAHLAFAGAQVSVQQFGCEEAGGHCSPEREAALQRARGSKAKFERIAPQSLAEQDWNLVIDGLFGIGLTRPIEGEKRALVEAVNALPCNRFALDVPSGLDADTGAIVGPDGVAIQATHTITYIGDKTGLYTCAGRDYAGDVQLARLDIDPALYPSTHCHLNDVKFFARHLKKRRHNTHKGSYGNVAVVGGAPGMGGAITLAARAALLTGAGRVYAYHIDVPPAYDSTQPELMLRRAQDFAIEGAVIVAGPGLGALDDSRAALAKSVHSSGPLLLDADALNLLSQDSALQATVAERSAPTVMTPHPLEAARLLGITSDAVQRNRPGAARDLAARLNAIVVLKGSGTVLAKPDGHTVVNTTGNPALATAGTGDVLAGLCGSLLAQGWPAWEAALSAVWLHGMAADVLVTEGLGPIGVTASELIPAIRTALNRMVQMHGR
ncbi:bifunctional ADP-dependent NAD(P)H-hydrate dehydratase/NAD(P)H-hydrate epimerase [Pseudoduganella ginsengisoli]|uniref:Bifunctional NAD(P)H-hydrate repair enzyme n=1 Tax=Pseudoduganella ginsengisoli TaxID=1462440 RepID=A0A6L6Q466_9BURK|nr:NAD(P)H-hydrate dehydratase [Pseudoduganella ginsengisoli]MTW04259.1 NAD(P)H-hydrate dehydratase [Pseudoduganella ginsengisoli]